MPGIITHHKIFLESINFLKKEKNRDLHSKSIETLFQTDDFRKAALFGTIGPNIFDYFPIRKNKYICGSHVSYKLHNEGVEKLLTSMINDVLNHKDHNNEWSATQRAYLYGFISHAISDSIFHPFIYYWSGFPGSNKKEDIHYFREQHLLFEYNIDMFITYYYDQEKFDFNLSNMLPVKSQKGLPIIDVAVKKILLKALKEVYPENDIIWLKGKSNGNYSLNYIDIIPHLIRLTYWIKRSRHQYLKKTIESLKRKKFIYSDFLVRYPDAGKINRDALNLHRERWFHPTGVKGLHYESAEDLLRLSSERVAEIWKKIESRLYTNEKDITDILKKFRINAITGEIDKSYENMHNTNPIRLRF